jgi:hypothetical protein
VAVCCWPLVAESDTRTLIGKVPLTVGVPDMTPVCGLRVRPAGSELSMSCQVSGVCPPVAATVKVYGEP